MTKSEYNIIIVTGATASGKTGFAARLAHVTGGEIISADSRQVYRGMDIGTGKDYDDYRVGDIIVPAHLIDIVDAGYKYNVYEYQHDFIEVYNKMKIRGCMPVVCGGSGMYIDSIVRGYKLINVPLNKALREELEQYDIAQLETRLKSYKNLHNRSDTDTRKRTVRAIEIEEYYLQNSELSGEFPSINPLITAIRYDRESRRRRISERLNVRMKAGMVDEVQQLLDSGISSEDLFYYGLEYKYITLYLTGKMSYDNMFTSLETEIHRFAKRQMTWFRGMERRGTKIHWLDGYLHDDEKLRMVLELLCK
ncbi:MAG: tRNA (adenosine(37)-N6)-dimethylallyltransferase MiaA [Bacteroidales bacterium]|nr:tRNA (adenosine(37)-N6)-dimethylallyltransferase MiaA [Bacteroidales bacterium]